MMSQSVVENVVKQGYLKKGNYGTSRLSGLFRRHDVNKWFVFTIRQGVPFLEYYDSDVDVFTHQPINSFNLSSCQNIKSMGNTNPPSFCIVCPDRVIELIASSRTQMVEWVHEVEASLIRLGILKHEVVDHVYTMCPAVVCKPRQSKEVSDEKETEASLSTLPTASNIYESRNSGEPSSQALSSLSSLPDPLPPPRSSRTLTLKPSSRAPLASRTSSSFHGSSQSASLEVTSPPPLPFRSSLRAGRTSNQRETEEAAVSDPKENPPIHPVTESSNDSDFVSPEVIAELRQQHQAFQRALSSKSEEEEVDARSTTPPITPSNLYMVMNKSYFDCGTVLDRSPSPNGKLQSTLEPLKIIKESRDFSGSSTSLDNISALTSSSPSLPCVSPDSLIRPEEVPENDYSVFPCQQEVSDSGITDENNSVGAIVSKPTPLPRKALPKVQSCPGDLISEAASNVNENKSITDFVSTDVPPASDTTMKNILTDDNHVVNGSQSCKSECTELEQVVENVYTSMLAKDEGNETGGTCTQQFSLKQLESSPSKDENENFYGLVFDEPPTTTAPPIPSIPPLPPRHDSLQARGDGSKSILTQEPKTVFSSLYANNPISSSLPPSAFSSASSGMHRSLPKDLTTAPPLPLPRKSDSNSEFFRKSLPSSAFTSNGSAEIPTIPPLLPRRGSPHFSFSQEDRPPSIPSRGSQSFFIKRPQITGLSSNMKSSSEDIFGQKNPSTSEDHAGGSESTFHETGSSTSASNLSRKMLLDRAHSLHTVVSLKQTQAEILQTEISMSSVAVTITQKAGRGIALVDWNNFACVAGWNQKDFPSLHGKLHLGDLIFSVNNVMVTNAEIAQKLLKQAPSSKIEIILHRMPYAKVFAILRNAEGQSLGIKRDGGTGEILYVDPNGLAAQHGLTSYAQSALGNGRCNWFLTEINNRPLSLFFKENEIDHRLSAVGREISLVVQPCDFIYEIRRQFKKVKNYKNFICQ